MAKQEDSKTKEGYMQEIIMDKSISVSLANGKLSIKGPKGVLIKEYNDKRITLTLSDDNILKISSKMFNKNIKKISNTFKAHIKNVIKGVKEGYLYEIKICSGHFPMKVAIDKNKFSIQNFLGEKVPRAIELNPDVKVTLEGDRIIVESCDKELAGQTAASIEQLTRRPGYDTRIFQDGCYIIKKAGKELK